MAPNTQAAERKEFTKQFASITFTVLSIIQGLAFQALVGKVIEACKQDYSWELAIFLTHATLCLMIILRVFQTYTSAALAYRMWRADVWDLLSIFMIGVFEFAMVDAVSSVVTAPTAFYRLYLAFAGLAVIATYRAYQRSPELEGQTKAQHTREVRIQTANLKLVGILLASAYIAAAWLFFGWPSFPFASIGVSLASSLLLFRHMAMAISAMFAPSDATPKDGIEPTRQRPNVDSISNKSQRSV